MASTKTTILAFLLTMLTLVGFSLGAVHKVGDSSGWTIGDIDYAQWASTTTFHVGDSLRKFKFPSFL
ncbi:Cupredoxin [Corchorus olitorius]|uniref:Cupredoxin n=1 Tax=Corchorus olitorius TaxID=93759 RepID=A0A1R3KFB6_9ROSI|nr:Cupredoxin [Corchorus olitorius]